MKISQATPRPAQLTDRLPIETPDDATGQNAYSVTVQDIHNALPQAGLHTRGIAEAASGTETDNLIDNPVAVTPQSLYHALRARHLAPSWCYIGTVTPNTTAAILSAFSTAFGRNVANRDLFTATINTRMAICIFNQPAGRITVITPATGTIQHYT